ncbi:MAG: Stk1 family PASTA domain-containing Ser/Thr kinase, partial [Actinomycetota bacterium]|nr:Stk1 family PASTA domain-containing Ser/Thr kinase [Actinomycetota bacterium]
MSTTHHTFGGRYEVIGRAGSGGMAEVYRARDELLGREVAVKVLNERLSGDRTFVERFRREAQAAANLNHPNIVSLYDFGADGNTYYIVMEYIDGRPLADIIQAEGPLMPERAAEIGVDVARALERAHNANLIHRDVKPSNIMLNSSGQTKVTDFGIARAMGGDGEQTMTQTGMVIGTAAYLSPEQAQGTPVDQRSDVYALGCVLYEMLAGTPPFTGDTPLSVAYRHVRENPQPPSAVNPDVPRAFDAIVMKALAKNPDNRYQSAAELREDLERFLSGQRVLATPLLAPEPTRTQVMAQETSAYEPPPKKRRWLWLLLLLLLIAGAALAYFLTRGAAEVDVPDVVGESQEEAEDIIEAAGLEPVIERQKSDEDRGVVFDQDPPAGEAVEEGGEVTLFVSSGPPKVSVPDVTGMTRREAKAALEDENLQLGAVESQFSDTVPAGDVISQNPEAGERIQPGSTVDLVVSGGPEPTIVPEVVGLDQASAEDELEAVGLVPSVQETASDDVDEGVVLDQDPDQGTAVADGSTVTIYVSTGPEAVVVPDVTGQPTPEARAQLEELGLVVEETEEICEEDIQPNHVCRT